MTPVIEAALGLASVEFRAAHDAHGGVDDLLAALGIALDGALGLTSLGGGVSRERCVRQLGGGMPSCGTDYAIFSLRVQRLISILAALGKQRTLRLGKRCCAQVLVAFGNLPLQIGKRDDIRYWISARGENSRPARMAKAIPWLREPVLEAVHITRP